MEIQTGIGDVVFLENDASPEEIKKGYKRAERNHILAQSDSTMVPDRALSESKLTEWKTYRQKLRDIDFSDPTKVVFPEKPDN